MSGRSLEIVSSGSLTTVQDLGRRGFQRYGIPVCGALDPVSLRIANMLVGNPEGAAGLEFTWIGPAVRFDSDCAVAVVGADFSPEVDGKPAPAWESAIVPAGSTLNVGIARDGLRGYMAVSGGIDVPLVMNSRSTDTKGGFGGFDGRPLGDGDRLPIGDSPIVDAIVADGWTGSGLPSEISRQPTYGQDFQLRVTLGPQDDEFTDAGIRAMSSSEYTVSMDSDRMGYRLEGPPIEHRSGADIVSDGSALGSVQVPGSGQPIALLADRGTTGGYTKVATVIGPDIGLLAQAMPGAKIRFATVSVEEAHEALREQEEMLREIKAFVGLDMSGAFSITSEGSVALVLDADGRPIAAPVVEPSKTARRNVSAKIDGEEFEFEFSVATL